MLGSNLGSLLFIYYYFYYLYFYILLFIYYYFIYKKSFYDYFSTCLPSRMEVRNTATAENIVLFVALGMNLACHNNQRGGSLNGNGSPRLKTAEV